MLQRPLCVVLQGSGTSAHPGEPPAEPLSGAASRDSIGMFSCRLARPGARGAAGSRLGRAHLASSPAPWHLHAGRSKGIRWPPEPQAPAGGRLLLLNDGVLFNTSFPGSVTRPRDEGTVLCHGLGTSPFLTEHRCAAVPPFPLWKGTSRSRTRLHLFFLPLLSLTIFSV